MRGTWGPALRAPTVRMIVVDDHALFREALARALSTQRDFEVAGTCGSVGEALDLVSRQGVDVVLLDLDLGDEEGVAFLRLARQRGFTGSVLAVTAGLHRWEAVRLARLGVAGIFLKHDSIEELCARIRGLTSAGGKSGGGKAGLEEVQEIVEQAGQGHEPVHRALTQRERDVLRLIFNGASNKEIAGQLQITESLAKELVQHLFSKSGVRTRGQLVRAAMQKYWRELELN